jgi:hypothetical protein
MIAIVYWNSVEAADKAAEEEKKSTSCSVFFGMINESSISVSRYSIEG